MGPKTPHQTSMTETFLENGYFSEAATKGVLFKVLLEISQISQENTCLTVSYLACNCIKKETLEKVFSCKFCEISKSTFSYRTPTVAAFAKFKYWSSCSLQYSRSNKITDPDMVSAISSQKLSLGSWTGWSFLTKECW